MLTPRRRRGVEHLDDPATDPRLRELSLADVRISNTLLGGTNAVMSELKRVLPRLGARATLLDVGTGLADIPAYARRVAAKRSVALTTIGVDEAWTVAAHNAHILDVSVCADARRLPFASHSMDVVTCSQMLHHLEDAELAVVLAELDRVARRAVIVSDLRRSWVAAGGFWIVSRVLRFHPITKHDGVVSVLRGFTTSELAGAVHRAVGGYPVIRRHPGFRLTATWTPTS